VLTRKQQEDPPKLPERDDVPTDLAELVGGVTRTPQTPLLGSCHAELANLTIDETPQDVQAT